MGGRGLWDYHAPERYAWFDSYGSVGYVLTLHISPPTVCPYLPIAKRAFFFCRVANFNVLERDVLW